MPARDHRRDGEPLDIEPVGLVVKLAHARGCTCDPPDLHFSGPLRRGQVTVVAVAHNAGCPLDPTANPTRTGDT
jgi:hypothetical protein